MRSIKLRVKAIDEGFTLIEMLLVITVLGILMGIAVIGFSGVTRASTIKACRVDYLSVESALNSFRNDFPGPGTDPLIKLDLYSSESGTLVDLGYMSKLNDNRAKYTITITKPATTGSLTGNILVEATDASDTDLKVKCKP